MRAGAQILPIIAMVIIGALAEFGIGCFGDIMSLLEEPGQRIVSSVEVIDKNAQLYNSLDLAVSDAKKLQQEIYNMTLYSGMDKFPNQLAGKFPSELLIFLEPETPDLHSYKESWNLAIADMGCMLELDCQSVCLNENCVEFESVKRGSARLPSKKPDEPMKDYLRETQEKLDIFIEAYEDALKVIDNQKKEFLKQQNNFEKNLNEVRPHITLQYESTKEILLELDENYCSKTLSIPSPEEEFYKSESINNQFKDVITEIETGPRFTNKYINFLFNRIQRLTNASLSLTLRNEKLESQVIPSIENHLKLSDCILGDVEKQVNEALNLAGSDSSLYKIEASVCRSKLTVPRTLDSEVETSQCLVDYVLKPISGEIVELSRLEEKLELTHNLLKVALDPLEEKTKIIGEEHSGENLEYYLANFKLQDLSNQLNQLNSQFQNLQNLPVKDYYKTAHKIEDELNDIGLNLKLLDDDAHKRKVNFLWNEVELEISKINERIAWLEEKGTISSINTQSEQDYTNQNSKFKLDEISSFRAFGHMNRLRQELDQLLQELQQKKSKLNPPITSKLEPQIEFKPIQVKLNQPAEITANIYIENPFPDEEFSKKLNLKAPISKALDVVIGKKGYTSQIKQTIIPITGKETTQAIISNYPSNTLIISKKITFTSIVKSDLEVPLGVIPYDFDCGNYNCRYSKKSLIISNLEGSDRITLTAHKENPIKVELGKKIGNDQIISITNKVPLEATASITIFTDDPNPILIDKYSNTQLQYSYNSFTNTLTFSTNLPQNSIKWIQITSVQSSSLPQTISSSAHPLIEKPTANHTYDEIYNMIILARENYHLTKFASKEHPKLILVNLDFLQSLLTSAQSKLSHQSQDAYNSALLAFNETQNSTNSASLTLYKEIMNKYNYIKQTEAKFSSLKPDQPQSDTILLHPELSQNTTQLDLDVQKLQDYHNQGDTENTILFGSRLLKSIDQTYLPRTTHYNQIEELVDEKISNAEDSQELEEARSSEKLGNSYVKSKNALLNLPFEIPWWLPLSGLLSIIALTLYVFKDNVAEVKHNFEKKIENYEKDLEEQEMAKYNI
jgi:hypothetical protein